MVEHAIGILPRNAKGRLAPPPVLGGAIGKVAYAVAALPGVTATAHWHLADRGRIDGIDFYVGEKELGHIHLDGSVHLATSPALGAAMLAANEAKPFPWYRGWVQSAIRSDGDIAVVIDLFRRNHDQLKY